MGTTHCPQAWPPQMIFQVAPQLLCDRPGALHTHLEWGERLAWGGPPRVPSPVAPLHMWPQGIFIEHEPN